MSGLHLAILALSFLGFVALAIGTGRYAKHLLRTVPSPQWRTAARVGGWLLLAAALALGVTGLVTAGERMKTTPYSALSVALLLTRKDEWRRI
ncbi:DUF3325 family protein [Sphingobium cloacae]|uniref:DUF3325 family protein n=1 Tax=Sphingobium cloacae TaxID=120107 RepID=UPI0009FC0F25|nr:DUF3325 family protein [Sphingobium cloacae]